MKEPEIFDIVVAVNRLKDALGRVEKKVDFLAKPMSEQIGRKYLTTDQASTVLKVSRRTLAKMRAEKEIPFIRVRRKIIYAVSDVEGFIERKRV